MCELGAGGQYLVHGGEWQTAEPATDACDAGCVRRLARLRLRRLRADARSVTGTALRIRVTARLLCHRHVAEAELEVHVARASEVSPATLYRILQLRVDVFVVEQGCAYRELDGRDLEPDSLAAMGRRPRRHVLATLRIVRDALAARIGRVATAGPRGRVDSPPD